MLETASGLRSHILNPDLQNQAVSKLTFLEQSSRNVVSEIYFQI